MADNKQESSRDGLALIVGGLFILALVFAAYNYFNKEPKGTAGITEEATSTNSVIERIKKAINPEEETEEEPIASKDVTKLTEQEYYSTWVATDYEKGDINSGTYTVKKGDTLWEISEAVYGSGFEWHQILEANEASIGYLPNGSQALIEVGQVLSIPAALN